MAVRAGAGPLPGAPAREKDRWMTASWLFLVEPTGPGRCRVVSRYRCDTSADLASRLQFGSAIVESVSFAMDRRMLIGIRQRAEQARKAPAEARHARHGGHPGSRPFWSAWPLTRSRAAGGPGPKAL
jgi:hypothetical protein